MQNKIFAPLFTLFWGAICYQGGKISQKEKKEDFSFNKVQIDQPTVNQQQQVQKEGQQRIMFVQNKSKIQDTFTDQLIESPIKKINYPNFKILYSKYHKCPLAVHQKVTKQLADGDAPRKSSFFVQETLDLPFRSTNDHFIKSGAYKNFYFARGHMAAAGNYSGNKQAKFQTFTYANVVPQNQYNNAGIWNTFQRYSRDLVMNGKCDNVEIISGPIYYKNNPYKNQNGQVLQKVFKQESIVLLQNGIVVPQKLYKIIKCNKKQQYYLNGFQFWNKKTFDNQKPLKQFIKPISSIQYQTGLKFNFDKISNQKKVGNLLDLDLEGMTKTKKHYDQGFYNNLMKKTTTIEELNNSFHRAKQQKIFINLDEYKVQTQNMFKKQIQQINQDYRKNKQINSCKSLYNLMKLNKNLFYLKQLTSQIEEQIKQSQLNGPLQKCLIKANDLRAKKWQDFTQEQRNSPINKDQKYKINSITHSITESFKKQQEILKSGKQIDQVKKITVPYINEQILKKFLIPVNLQTTLAQATKQKNQKLN